MYLKVKQKNNRVTANQATPKFDTDTNPKHQFQLQVLQSPTMAIEGAWHQTNWYSANSNHKHETDISPCQCHPNQECHINPCFMNPIHSSSSFLSSNTICPSKTFP